MKQTTQHQGFAPLFDKNSKVLVLGSFPSVRSRSQNFYYGNKQNRFWATMQSVFGGKIDTVQQKTQLCLQNNIALWDIVAVCDIQGSLDTNIKNPIFVNLEEVLACSNVCAILCNGKKAYEFTLTAYKGVLPVECLPSTSPANTRFDQTIWRNALNKYLKE